MARTVRGPRLEVPETTLPRMFLQTVERHPDGDCVRFRGPDDAWATWSWDEARNRVQHVGHGLLDLSVEPGDRVAIMADTRVEWLLADLATMSAGGVTTSIYTTLNPDQVAYLLEDAAPRVVVVDTQASLDKLREVPHALEGVEHIVAMDEVDAGKLADRTLQLDELRARGKVHQQAHPDALQERISAAEPTDPALIIYTSGTTGQPKGCVSTHRNYVASCASIDHLVSAGPGDVGLAFLPLAHSFQRQATFFTIYKGVTGVFTTPARLGDDLKEVRPTLMVAVPRIFERIHEGVTDKVEEANPLRQRIFHAASNVARKVGEARSGGGTPGPVLQAQHAFFDRLVYGKIREAVGLDRLRLVFTGAAAIRPRLLHWLRGVGVPILEGYGLTETSAPSNLNPPNRWVPGTVGPPIPGVEEKLALQEGSREVGEVLIRGPVVFEGYWQLPDETEEAFTSDGWFRSGDLGAFDDDGYLRIIDRLKALEVLSTGKNVAPVPIEEALKESDWVAEAMVVGSDRKYVTALVQPNYERVLRHLEAEGETVPDTAITRGTDPTGDPTVLGVDAPYLQRERVRRPILDHVDEVNPRFAHHEQVKAVRLVPHAFTIEREELTPTLKKKRRVIRGNWRTLIDSMYPEDG